jgi:phage tail-like protein
MPTQPITTERSSGVMEDPLRAFNFQLDFSGNIAGFFSECSGVGSENEIIEMKVVDNNGKDAVRKMPGRLKWTDISLKRGITSDLQIWQWRDQVVKGDMEGSRKAVTISMLDMEGNPIAKWHFINAWPSKVTGPAFKADDNNFGVEEVSITHEGMYREL